jgi:hypothetical protein
MNLLNWIADRLSENSTWRGLLGVATAAGVAIKPDQGEAIIAAGMAVIGLINVFRKQAK